MRITICAAVIRNGRILLVRNEETWILPGGKPVGDETDLECLSREVCEELGVEIVNPSFFTTVEGRTPHRGDIIKVKIYFAEIMGKPQPRAEISEVAWVRRNNSYNLSEPTRIIFQKLNSKGYL